MFTWLGSASLSSQSCYCISLLRKQSKIVRNCMDMVKILFITFCTFLYVKCTQWGIISGPPITFGRNFGNYSPNLMILSTLWTELLVLLLFIAAKSAWHFCQELLIFDSLLKGYMIKTKGFGSYVHSRWLSKVELGCGGKFYSVLECRSLLSTALKESLSSDSN